MVLCLQTPPNLLLLLLGQYDDKDKERSILVPKFCMILDKSVNVLPVLGSAKPKLIINDAKVGDRKKTKYNNKKKEKKKKRNTVHKIE